jgi:hypothetical protein
MNEYQLAKLKTHMNSFKRSFLISFESTVDGSSVTYWRFQNTMQIFSLQINSNTAKVGDFVREFLLSSLKNNFNGKACCERVQKKKKFLNIKFKFF